MGSDCFISAVSVSLSTVCIGHNFQLWQLTASKKAAISTVYRYTCLLKHYQWWFYRYLPGSSTPVLSTGISTTAVSSVLNCSDQNLFFSVWQTNNCCLNNYSCFVLSTNLATLISTSFGGWQCSLLVETRWLFSSVTPSSYQHIASMFVPPCQVDLGYAWIHLELETLLLSL